MVLDVVSTQRHWGSTAVVTPWMQESFCLPVFPLGSYNRLLVQTSEQIAGADLG